MSFIRIYTKTPCGYCDAAKIFCKEKGFDFEEFSLDDQPEEMQRLSEENNGWRTFPMIFVGKKFVGGYTDMLNLSEKGELDRLLKDEETSSLN